MEAGINDIFGNYEIHYEKKYCIVKKMQENHYIRISGKQYLNIMEEFPYMTEDKIIQKLNHFFTANSSNNHRGRIGHNISLQRKKSKTCSMMTIILSIAVSLFLLPTLTNVKIGNAENWFLSGLFTVLNIILHEIGHIFFCLKAGRKVNAIGFKFNYFFPMVFVDTTDICMTNKKDRIKTSLGGVFFNSMIGHVSLVLSVIFDFLPFKLLSLTAYFFVLSNLIPFLKMDGYYVLEDILEVQRLRERSLQAIRKIRYNKNEKRFLMYYAYGIFNLLFVIHIIVVVLFGILVKTSDI